MSAERTPGGMDGTLLRLAHTYTAVPRVPADIQSSLLRALENLLHRVESVGWVTSAAAEEIQRLVDDAHAAIEKERAR